MSSVCRQPIRGTSQNTTTINSTVTWGHDRADRITTTTHPSATGAYVYDLLGRNTTIPAPDTPTGVGDLTLAYYDTDAAYQITQAGATTTFTLDPGGRRATQTDTTGTDTTRTIRHYTDPSDNPGYATHTDATGTTTTWYDTDITGNLAIAATTDPAGTTTLDLTLTDPLDALTTTLTIPTTDPTAITIAPVLTFDEYGNPTGNTTAGASETGVIAYNWQAANQRATITTGLTLMGARLYNPATGQFTTPDPTPGGNTTTYTYPQNPINKNDPTGNNWLGRNWRTLAAIGVMALCLIASVLACIGAGLVVAYFSDSVLDSAGNWKTDWNKFAVDSAFTLVGGAVGKLTGGNFLKSYIARDFKIPSLGNIKGPVNLSATVNSVKKNIVKTAVAYPMKLSVDVAHKHLSRRWR